MYNLPVAIKLNDKLLNLENSLGLAIFSVLNSKCTYSQSEKLIGKWIDDKPIYMRSFTGNCPTYEKLSNLRLSIAIPLILNVNSIIFFNGFYTIKNNGNNVKVNINYLGQNTEMVNRITSTVYVKNNTAYLYFCCYNSSSELPYFSTEGLPYEIILYYTKN